MSVEHLSGAEAEHLEAHLSLWQAYVHPDANPTEIELWGAVRSACDWVPKLLAERRALKEAGQACVAALAESHRAYEQAHADRMEMVAPERAAQLAEASRTIDALRAERGELRSILERLRVDDWYVYEGRLEASATHPVDLMDELRALLGREGGA